MTSDRVAGTLRLRALVTFVNDVASFDEHESNRLANGIRLLNCLLAAVGSFQMCEDIQPEDGAVLVDILDCGSSDSGTFNKTNFYEFICALQECVPSQMNQENLARKIEECAIALASQFAFNAEQIRKALSLVIERKCRFSLIDDEGREITLSPSCRKITSGDDQRKITVAAIRHICIVATNRDSYEIDAANLADLKLGDRVVIVEPSPFEKHRCIRADKATFDEDEPDFFGYGTQSEK